MVRSLGKESVYLIGGMVLLALAYPALAATPLSTATRGVALDTLRPLVQQPAKKAAFGLKVGKYACVTTQYQASTQFYETVPKGTIELKAGRYRYLGFEQPSQGTYTVDTVARKIHFHKGYLDKGLAEPIEGSPDRFRLVTPTLAGSRWTCGLTIDG